MDRLRHSCLDQEAQHPVNVNATLDDAQLRLGRFRAPLITV
jgi:hypothetical protein